MMNTVPARWFSWIPEERKRVLWAGFLLAKLMLSWTVVAGTVSAADYEYLVVGLLIQGKEVAVIETVQQGDVFFLPLESFAQVTGATLTMEDEVSQLLTPLGKVSLYNEYLHVIDGERYLDQYALEELLHTRVTFLPDEFALALDVPWRQEREDSAPGESSVRIIPEILPPHSSLSTLQTDLTFRTIDGELDDLYSATLGGRVYGASWKAAIDRDFQGENHVSEYEVFRIRGNWLMQGGLQSVHLHPLLDVVDLTGIQIGWTNRTVEEFAFQADAREVLTRHSTPVKTLRGEAPPGFLVQLRVNGSIEAEQTVGLDGVYEFVEVPLSSHALNQIQLYLFDYHDTLVPVEIREVRLNTSALLLPKRKNVFLLGGGTSGNWIDTFLSSDDDEQEPSGLTAFSQWRYGLTEHLTLEATAQHRSKTTQIQGGLISRFRNVWVFAAGIGLSNEKNLGYSAELDGIFSRWRLLAKGFWIAPNFRIQNQSRTWRNDSLELAWEGWRQVKLGVLGRRYQTDDEEAEYFLPFASMTLLPGLSLQARPEYSGKYRIQGDYRFASGTHCSAIFLDPSWKLSVSQRFFSRYTVTLSSIFSDLDASVRYAVAMNYQGDWKRGTRLFARFLGDDDQQHVAFGGSRYIFPGIRAELEYQTSSDIEEEEDREYMLSARISTDFTLAGKRLLPAYNENELKTHGAIAGRIVVQGSEKKTAYDLGEIGILINGKRRGLLTGKGGNFFKGDLKQGVYTVELDLENVPIDLVPERTVVTVGVAAGATTCVDFSLRPEYGVAGRVTDLAGQILEGILVELYDSAGTRLQTARTDCFGLYRIDGIPPGTYVIRIATEHALLQSQERQVVITDDFLFDQDLQLLSGKE